MAAACACRAVFQAPPLEAFSLGVAATSRAARAYADRVASQPELLRVSVPRYDQALRVRRDHLGRWDAAVKVLRLGPPEDALVVRDVGHWVVHFREQYRESDRGFLSAASVAAQGLLAARQEALHWQQVEPPQVACLVAAAELEEEPPVADA